VDAELTDRIVNVGAVAHQAAGLDQLTLSRPGAESWFDTRLDVSLASDKAGSMKGRARNADRLRDKKREAGHS
jgi:hypothetical protein